MENEIILSKVTDHVIQLPRLVLSYYISIAFIITVVLFILWLIFKKKEIVSRCISKIYLLTGSYIVSQISLKGFKFTTYTIQKDLIIILFRTLVIYLIVLIANEIIFSNTKHF